MRAAEEALLASGDSAASFTTCRKAANRPLRWDEQLNVTETSIRAAKSASTGRPSLPFGPFQLTTAQNAGALTRFFDVELHNLDRTSFSDSLVETMSQVVTARFAAMPKFEIILHEWHAHGTYRHITATAVELCPTYGTDTVLVSYRPEQNELFVEGSLCEATWCWVDDVRKRYRGTLLEEEVGPHEKREKLEWRKLAWYWKAVGIVGIILLLPIFLPLCAIYVLWQFGRLAFKLKKATNQPLRATQPSGRG